MLMKVQYTFYKPEKGLEEIQATIYNEALRKYGKGITVTAEQIKQRYNSEKPDPKGIRYALKDDDAPLAYIQTRVTEVMMKKEHILDTLGLQMNVHWKFKRNSLKKCWNISKQEMQIVK